MQPWNVCMVLPFHACLSDLFGRFCLGVQVAGGTACRCAIRIISDLSCQRVSKVIKLWSCAYSPLAYKLEWGVKCIVSAVTVVLFESRGRKTPKSFRGWEPHVLHHFMAVNPPKMTAKLVDATARLCKSLAELMNSNSNTNKQGQKAEKAGQKAPPSRRFLQQLKALGGLGMSWMGDMRQLIFPMPRPWEDVCFFHWFFNRFVLEGRTSGLCGSMRIPQMLNIPNQGVACPLLVSLTLNLDSFFLVLKVYHSQPLGPKQMTNSGFFGTWILCFHSVGNNHPNWLSYFLEGLKKKTPTSCYPSSEAPILHQLAGPVQPWPVTQSVPDGRPFPARKRLIQRLQSGKSSAIARRQTCSSRIRSFVLECLGLACGKDVRWPAGTQLTRTFQIGAQAANRTGFRFLNVLIWGDCEGLAMGDRWGISPKYPNFSRRHKMSRCHHRSLISEAASVTWLPGAWGKGPGVLQLPRSVGFELVQVPR